MVSVVLALVFSLSAMFLWGSWANAMLVAKVRFELFFLDYMFGNAIIALCRLPAAIAAMDVAWASGGGSCYASVGLSILAGALYAFGCFMQVSAVDLAGMAAAIPLVVGFEFLAGTPLLLVMEGAGSALHVALSLLGVAAVALAVVFDCLCHAKLEADRSTDENTAAFPLMSSSRAMRRGSCLSQMSFAVNTTIRDRKVDVTSSLPVTSLRPHGSDLPCLLASKRGSPHGTKSEPIGAFARRCRRSSLVQFLCQEDPITRQRTGSIDAENIAASQPLEDVSRELDPPTSAGGSSGLIFALIAGACFAFWPALSSIAEGRCIFFSLGSGALPAAAFYVLYVAGGLLAALVIAPALSSRPIHTGPSFAFGQAYFGLSAFEHLLGVCGGVAQGLGTLLALTAGDSPLGNAVAMSITRCAPVVAAAWGLFVWGEMRGAKCVTASYFAGMIVAFLSAVSLLAAAGIVAK